ncbi:four helix bundle protein [Thiocapsa bogorovii]|uniref:four helix bundle protein n=1 Tax=Thiocapsa bogorovii TaxID=521689 RepID=UPI001E6046F5|nr:four helix bundle protein [Thiocapsa bogorovii]UHD17000.1 four helix bundle protein [Thiocapsa bogorovii]
MQDFRDLLVWVKAHDATLAVYRYTQTFPSDERFGLTFQIRRAAVSVASNIAEGSGRRSDADFARFLSIAFGSASEVEYQALLARDLGYMSDSEHQEIRDRLSEVKRMLSSLIKRLTTENR